MRIFLIVISFLLLSISYVSAQESITLKSSANKLNITLGTSGSSGKIKYIPEYASAITTHFNHITSDWELHWGIDKDNPFRPDRNTFSHYWMDELVSFAEANNLTVEGHHLVWGYKPSLPNWLLNSNFSREELMTIMHEHIQEVAGRYQGKINTWSVVNEPFGFSWDGTFWHEELGPGTGWIDQAFIWANESDPTANLILNDAGIEFPNLQPFPTDRYDLIYNLVVDMKQRDIPIDGIGFQMHLNAKDFTGEQLATRMQQLATNIQRYKAAGLDVYITEFDIRVDEIGGTQEERYQQQALIYKEVIKTAITNGVNSISTFGLTDEHSWYEDSSPDADATLLTNYTPKVAYDATIEGLKDIFQQRGDANRDLSISGIDYVIWLNNFGKTTTIGAVDGDFNQDGVVSGVDYVIWLNNYTG